MRSFPPGPMGPQDVVQFQKGTNTRWSRASVFSHQRSSPNDWGKTSAHCNPLIRWSFEGAWTRLVAEPSVPFQWTFTFTTFLKNLHPIWWSFRLQQDLSSRRESLIEPLTTGSSNFSSRFHYKLVKKLRSCSKKEKKLRSFVHFTKTRKELGGGRLLLRESRIRPKSTIQL